MSIACGSWVSSSRSWRHTPDCRSDSSKRSVSGSPSASQQGKPSNALRATIKRLTAGEASDPAELTEAFEVILAGDATPVQIAALLVGLRVKGETPQELA